MGRKGLFPLRLRCAFRAIVSDSERQWTICSDVALATRSAAVVEILFNCQHSTGALMHCSTAQKIIAGQAESNGSLLMIYDYHLQADGLETRISFMAPTLVGLSSTKLPFQLPSWYMFVVALAVNICRSTTLYRFRLLFMSPSRSRSYLFTSRAAVSTRVLESIRVQKLLE